MATPPSARPLWTCPDCGRTFANRNQAHACGRHALEPHFRGRDPEVRRIYDAFAAMLRDFGPVEVLPEQSRIAFHVRMSFAQLTVRKAWVLGHLVLARAFEEGPFTRIETFSPRNIVHHSAWSGRTRSRRCGRSPAKPMT